MHIDQAIEQYLDSVPAIPAALNAVLADSGQRQALYRALLVQPAAPFRPLLLAALDCEVAFRGDLFEGRCEDSGDHYEGIYRCAFLLYRVGDVADTLALWSAKHVNMDVGSSLGAEYFFGAGVADTLAFLDGWGDSDAVDLLAYLQEFLAYEGSEWRHREQWECEQIENIRAGTHL